MKQAVEAVLAAFFRLPKGERTEVMLALSEWASARGELREAIEARFRAPPPTTPKDAVQDDNAHAPGE